MVPARSFWVLPEETYNVPISAEVGLASRLRVGEWRVAPELNSLERDGHSVHVEPKIMQVLVTLAERPGTVLSKEHILRQVWPETFVSEEVLTRSISELRRVFEDNPREPTYIQTIPKGGYRLLAPVVAEGMDREMISTIWWERKRWGLVIAAVIVLLGALSFYFMNRRQHAASRPRISSLAVLPLTNLSGDASQDYFTDGLTDELTTRLAKISALRVISRTSVMQYKGGTKTAPEIARELNVDALLVGSVLRSGDRSQNQRTIDRGSKRQEPVDRKLRTRSPRHSCIAGRSSAHGRRTNQDSGNAAGKREGVYRPDREPRGLRFIS